LRTNSMIRYLLDVVIQHPKDSRLIFVPQDVLQRDC
jgi:hypothetical protein